MTSSYKFEAIAAIKALLHACKHPTVTVTGVFVGEQVEADDDNIVVTDYFPLFHSFTSIGPCCEGALCQVSKLASMKGLQVVGLLEADANVVPVQDDPQSPGRAMADRLLQNGSNLCSLFVIDNTKLGEVMNEVSSTLPFQVLGRTAGSKYARTSASCSINSTNDIAATLKKQLDAKLHYKLCDFDDHLDNLSRDWQNSDMKLL